MKWWVYCMQHSNIPERILGRIDERIPGEIPKGISEKKNLTKSWKGSCENP